MNSVRSRLERASTVGRLRWGVLAIAVLATLLKLMIAKNSFGTNDVSYWMSFAQGVREFGPVELYGHQFKAQYNHPPLAGWMLVAVNWLGDHGVASFEFMIRVPASLADLVTALLIFELIRLHRSPREAALAAVLVVCSPALIVISGFHGNTDPVFVMLSLLTVYLLLVPRWATAAGLAFATAISVRLVPIILGPLLLVILLRLGWRKLAAFTAGCAAVFVPLWGPVVLNRWPEFKANVLSYPGIRVREWGVVQFAKWAHAPESWMDFLVGPGRFVVLGLSAVLPALIVWRRPDRVGSTVALSLALFLLLSSAFGMQYLVWPLAAAYLVSTWGATIYNVCTSVFVVMVYDNWNKAHPWDWYRAQATLFRDRDFVAMVVVWIALAVVVALALRLGRDRGPGPTGPAEPATADTLAIDRNRTRHRPPVPSAIGGDAEPYPSGSTAGRD
jgi:hypothetical protein